MDQQGNFARRPLQSNPTMNSPLKNYNTGTTPNYSFNNSVSGAPSPLSKMIPNVPASVNPTNSATTHTDSLMDQNNTNSEKPVVPQVASTNSMTSTAHITNNPAGIGAAVPPKGLPGATFVNVPPSNSLHSNHSNAIPNARNSPPQSSTHIPAPHSNPVPSIPAQTSPSFPPSVPKSPATATSARPQASNAQQRQYQELQQAFAAAHSARANANNTNNHNGNGNQQSPEMAAMKSEMQKMIQELQHLREQSETEKATKEGEISILRAKLSAASEDVTSLKQQLLHKDKKGEEHQKELEKMQVQMAFAEHEIREVSEKQGVLKNSKEKQPNEEKGMRLPATNTIISPIRAESGKKRVSIRETKSDHHNHGFPEDSASPNKKARTSSSVDKENELLRKTLTQLKQRLKGVKRALNGEFDNEFETERIVMREEIAEIFRSEIQALKKPSSANYDMLGTPSPSPATMNEALEIEVRKLNEEIQEYKKALSIEKAKSASLESRTSENKKERETLREKILELTKENESQRQNVLQLFNKSVEWEHKHSDLKLQLMSKEEEIKFLQERMEKERSQVQSEMGDLKKMLQMMHEQKQQSQQQIENLNKQVESLQSELATKNTTDASTGMSQQNREQELQEYVQVISHFKVAVESLQQTIQDKDREMEALKTAKSEVEQNFINLYQLVTNGTPNPTQIPVGEMVVPSSQAQPDPVLPSASTSPSSEKKEVAVPESSQSSSASTTNSNPNSSSRPNQVSASPSSSAPTETLSSIPPVDIHPLSSSTEQPP